MNLRGKTVKVCYIVGVATWPEYRGQGLVKQLLKHTGHVLRSRNIHLSILLPFKYDFYRKYGWEICYDLLRYKNIEIPHRPEPICGRFEKIEPLKDIDKLSDCYLQYMKHFNGYIIRTEKNWEKTLKDIELDNGTGYTYIENNEVLGYILYIINSKSLIIKELAYKSPQAKKALLQLALSHIGQVDNVIRIAPISDMDYLKMADSRGKIEKQTFVMGRIHDVKEALSGLPYKGDAFVIKVNDDFGDNGKRYLIEQDREFSYVTETSRNEDIVIDIKTLNQLLWGYLPPDNALLEGLLSCRNESAHNNLNLLFPKMCNYMTEEY